ncbi:hypothetical protein MLD38_036487 [Melastoma candidum]|uniref:Uncharacterized protein n=1 Tax=Melastoma candidum TaxID=119954 RepID=A0ACB9LJW0_9MYRT|nr:hypothetical protein MLD38_036487 [Melastoma candidum]
MEFIDDDRPRLLFQSHPIPPSPSSGEGPVRCGSSSLIFRSATTVASLVLISVSLFYIQSEPYKSLLLYLSLSLLISPFAPPSLTGGDIRVGSGPIVQFPESGEDDAAAEEKPQRKSNPNQKRSKSHFEQNPITNYVPQVVGGPTFSKESAPDPIQVRGVITGIKERKDESWSDEDVTMLRKQLVKHPAGKLKRWEVIAGAFGDRFSVEGVIRKAKELGDKKASDGDDSYAKFLRNRKPLDNRLVTEEEFGDGMIERGIEIEEKGKDSGWSGNEDISLLNALKAFPKETSMRWEKIAAAVPGRSKAECMKRVSELKKDFRSSKATKEG